MYKLALAASFNGENSGDGTGDNSRGPTTPVEGVECQVHASALSAPPLHAARAASRATLLDRAQR